MILSSKHYAKVNDEAKKIFCELQKVGVIHKEPNSLTYELNIFKKNPLHWMTEPRRRKAIENFSSKYAYVENEWNKVWKDYLKKLK